MSIIFRHSGRNTGAAATALLVGLLAVGSAVAAESDVVARKKGQPQEKIVALEFDAGSNTLFKAYPAAIYRSNNEGRDWEAIALPQAIKRGRIVSISVAAKDQGTLYVAGSGFGVLRSADGGRSWVAKNDGLPTKDIATLSSHADQPQTLYVYATRHGIFRSEDAGDHWRLMDAGPREKVLQFVHSNMPGSMQTGWLFAATAKGVDRSMDCFCGWRDAGGLGRPVTAVAYDPRETKRVYAATAQGLFASVDGGEQWSRVEAPGNISALVATPAGVLYAAVGEQLFRSADRGATWRPLDA